MQTRRAAVWFYESGPPWKGGDIFAWQIWLQGCDWFGREGHWPLISSFRKLQVRSHCLSCNGACQTILSDWKEWESLGCCALTQCTSIHWNYGGCQGVAVIGWQKTSFLWIVAWSVAVIVRQTQSGVFEPMEDFQTGDSTNINISESDCHMCFLIQRGATWRLFVASTHTGKCRDNKDRSRQRGVRLSNPCQTTFAALSPMKGIQVSVRITLTEPPLGVSRWQTLPVALVLRPMSLSTCTLLWCHGDVTL